LQTPSRSKYLHRIWMSLSIVYVVHWSFLNDKGEGRSRWAQHYCTLVATALPFRSATKEAKRPERGFWNFPS
jgi:hypothetical protein